MKVSQYVAVGFAKSESPIRMEYFSWFLFFMPADARRRRLLATSGSAYNRTGDSESLQTHVRLFQSPSRPRSFCLILCPVSSSFPSIRTHHVYHSHAEYNRKRDKEKIEILPGLAWQATRNTSLPRTVCDLFFFFLSSRLRPFVHDGIFNLSQ
jgi:hypothetical protein